MQSAGTVAIGAKATSQQQATQSSDLAITPDSALQFLQYSKGTDTFADYTAAKARSQASAQPTVGSQDDDQDDADLQQALIASRQPSQPQGSDPSASSSTSAQRSTQEELNQELKAGRHLQHESDQLEQKMSTVGLSANELERFRKVSQLWHTNKKRVTELVERQLQEHQAQQAQATQKLLGSMQSLQPAKPKAQQVVKLPPAPARAAPTPMGPPKAIVKTLPFAMGQKGRAPAPPPKPPAKDPSVPPKASSAPGSDQELQRGRDHPPPSPSTRKDDKQDQVVSPRGRPPPRVAQPRLKLPAQSSGEQEASDTSKGGATDTAAALDREQKSSEDWTRSIWKTDIRFCLLNYPNNWIGRSGRIKRSSSMPFVDMDEW